MKVSTKMKEAIRMLGFTLATSHMLTLLIFATTTYWANDYIETAKTTGLMTGVTATDFAPDDNMTIAQFAVVVVNGALEGNTITTYADYWATDYLVTSLQNCFFDELLGNDKLIYGASDGWADKAITREQVSFILANVLKKQGATLPTNASSVLSQFTDVHASSYAQTEFGYGVAVMVDQGIMNGSVANGKNVFNPEGNMTRAEVCVIISNLLDKGIFKAVSTSNSTTTPSAGTTTIPNTGSTTTPSTGTTTTTSSKPSTTAGTPAYTNSDMGIKADKPDDVVAGSGQYNVNVYNVPADTNKDGWITYREVMAVWEKIYAEYPDGTPWTNETHSYTSNVYWTGSVGITNKGLGCAAFAWMCSDQIFGNLPVRKVIATTNQNPLEVIRPGDVSWGKAIQHWSIVGGTAYVEGYPALDNNISTHSGNSNSMVQYGAFNNTYVRARDSIVAGTANLFTRYPAA